MCKLQHSVYTNLQYHQHAAEAYLKKRGNLDNFKHKKLLIMLDKTIRFGACCGNHDFSMLEVVLYFKYIFLFDQSAEKNKMLANLGFVDCMSFTIFFNFTHVFKINLP